MANKNRELFLVKYNNTPNSDRIGAMFYRGGRKVIELDKFAKIKEEKLKGFSKSQVSRHLELDPKTIDKYWEMANQEYMNLLLKSKSRDKKVDRYKDLILEWIEEYRDMSTAQIYDWLRERYGEVDFKDRTLRLYVNNLRIENNLPKGLKARQYQQVPELPIGYQIQTDFGQIWLKKKDGSKIKVYCFAMVLSHSRYKFLWWSDKPFTTATFIDAHSKAFEFFGGMTKEIVYDQDRLLAVSENGGDIIYTEGFQNYIDSTKFSVRLCRAYDPESKGKIEAVVKFAKYNFARYRIFEDIDSLNDDSFKWLERTGNKKVHEVTKKIPAEVFTLEKEHLIQVSNLFTNINLNSILTYIVRKNNTVLYKQNSYQVPKGTYQPGLEVELKILDNKMDILNNKTSEIIVSHTVMTGKGGLSQIYHPEREKNTKVDQIYEKTLLGLGGTDKARELLDNIGKEKSRYIKDQYGLILKETKKYNEDVIKEGIDYCIDRRLYSAGIFKDALVYIYSKLKIKSEETGKPYKPVDLSVPLKYKGLKPEDRSINEYINCFKGARKEWES